MYTMYKRYVYLNIVIYYILYALQCAFTQETCASRAWCVVFAVASKSWDHF